MAEDAASWVLSLTDHITPGAKSAEHSLGGVDKALKNTGTAASESGEASSGAASAMGGAYAAAAAAVVAAAVAIGAITLKMAEMSIHAHEAQQAALGLAQAEYGSSKAAQAVVDAQYAVSASSSLSQQAVFDLGTQLERSGVSADQFKDTLKAMADTSAVAGDQALKPIQKILKTVEQTGQFKLNDSALKGSGIKMSELYDQLAKNIGGSADQIATKVKLGQIKAEDGIKAMNQVLETKFSGAASDKVLDFDTQISKAKENLGNMFKDVQTGPFLSALHKVLSFLDPATASGKALHNVLTKAMNGFFSAASKALPYAEAFLLNVGIAGLDAYLSLKPLVKETLHFLGMDTAKPADGMKAVKIAAQAVVGAIGLIIAAVGVVGAVTVMQFNAIKTVIHGAVSAVHTIGHAFHSAVAGVKAAGAKIKSGLSTAVTFLEGLPGQFADAGKAMIDGLIHAIENGASAVASAVKNMASGAVKAAKETLGIHSPSKVFYEIGEFNVAGLTDAHKDGVSKVQSSMHHLVSVAANDNARTRTGSVSEVASGSSQSSSGKALSVAQGAVVINIYPREGQDERSIGQEVRRQLDDYFEEQATGTGGR